MNTLQQAMIAIYANLVRSGARTIDSIPKPARRSPEAPRPMELG